jgi:XTP/dITP diphosphohydrolase
MFIWKRFSVYIGYDSLSNWVGNRSTQEERFKEIKSINGMLYFITTNKNKVKEAEKILNGFQIKQIDREYPEVQGDSSIEVVRFAIDFLRNEKKVLILEDTSLFVESLKGFPGAYASYVQKTIGNEGILALMKDSKNRKAYFETAIGYHSLSLSENTKIFAAKCYGTIACEKRGENGFGYDPIFVPEGNDKTFGEMSTKEKNLYSHRAKAFKKLKAWLEDKQQFSIKLKK